eukprot:Rhum_TRINITY_DN21197_c0_g1::Rhum_TRINITY_DN21197_c0_g1_i1::g.173173::m.173173/K14379/ACP5; tartrate-resistant acid phosphatase type 5
MGMCSGQRGMLLLACALLAVTSQLSGVQAAESDGAAIEGVSEAEIAQLVASTGVLDRFVSMGCWGGDRSSRGRQRKVGALMGRLQEQWRIAYTVAAGDNFYKRGVNSATEGRWAETFESVYPPGLPFYAALGNHDYKGNIWAQVNRTFERANALAPAPAAPEGGALAGKHRWNLPFPYYTKVLGKVYMVVIDTVLMERCEVNRPKPKVFKERCWDGDKMVAWIEQKLQEAERSSNTLYTVVVGHYPMYANGPHRNQKWLQDVLTPLLQKYNVALYINADNHYMQYSQVNGVTYLNAGGGAGYMLHNKGEKDHFLHPSSVWQFFGDGLFAHFVLPDKLVTFAVEPTRGVLHRFDIPQRGRTGFRQDEQVVARSAPVDVLDPYHTAPRPLDAALPSAAPPLSARPQRAVVSAVVRDPPGTGGVSGGPPPLTRHDELLYTVAVFGAVVFLLIFTDVRRRSAMLLSRLTKGGFLSGEHES